MPDDRYEFRFRVEMARGQELRQVDADSYHADGRWVRFFRRGELYWMANQDQVVGMEAERLPGGKGMPL